MLISPVGILFILTTIGIIISEKKLANFLIFCTVTDIFFEAGYFIKMDETHLMLFSEYVQNVTVFYCFFYFISNRFSLSRDYLLLNLSYIIPILFLILFPSDVLIADGVYNGIWDDVLTGEGAAVPPSVNGSVITYTRRFIYATFIAVTVYENFGYDDYKYFLINLSKIVKFFLLLGLLEVLVRNVLGYGLLWGQFLESILGYTESTYIYDDYSRGDDGGIGLALFTREASHYAFSLLLCLIINFAGNLFKDCNKRFDLFTAICIFLMLLSTSFSTILFLSTFVVLYLIYRWTILCPSTMKKEILFVSLFIFVGSSIFVSVLSGHSDGFVTGRLLNFYDQFGDFFDVEGLYDESLGDSSTFVRIYSVIMTVIAFLSRPLFGLSLGAAYCHGATAMLLSGIGIFGMCYFVKFYFYDKSFNILFKVRNIPFIAAIFLYFLINMLNSLELRPFCNTTLIAIALCFSVIYSYPMDKNEIESNEENEDAI